MNQSVLFFEDIEPAKLSLAGGKGGMLAKLFQRGYPVPDGFVVFPAAFQEESLTQQARQRICGYLLALRQRYGQELFAVRSSAWNEDSAQASFAGGFETVLNVKTDQEILTAIDTVFRSRLSERVKAYSAVQGLELSHRIAVVVQLMVKPEFSGVLFTADPVTGSYANMVGNYVPGLGEQLVAGQTNAQSFSFIQPQGHYDGPAEFEPYAAKIYQLAARLERELGYPQDIEWAVAKGKLHLLQTRPITTLRPGNPDTYEWNDSVNGDFIWVNTNIGEAIPDVMTPLTWAVVRALDKELNLLPGFYLISGNICGRAYSNISLRLSVAMTFGLKPERILEINREVFGQMPPDMKLPVYPFSRFKLLRILIPGLIRYLKKFAIAYAGNNKYLKRTPAWCSTMTARIRNVNNKEELRALWQNEIQPYTFKAWWALTAGGSRTVLAMSLKKQLVKLVGLEDANALLSNLRGTTELASLGPVVGIAKIIKGEMSQEEYLLRYGHRGPHEFELSIPHPAEDISWLERQLAGFVQSDRDVDAMLKRQYQHYQEAWLRFEQRYPSKVKWLQKQIAKAAEASRLREAVRSEFIRVFRVNRAFAVRAGELTNLGEEIFFLYLHEVLEVLSGNTSAVQHVPVRRETYHKYQTLPPFPAIIRGRFDPFAWAADPQRRSDYYDATLPYLQQDSEILKGFAGAAGRREGLVRILMAPEEGELLQSGEILVASTTNIGWTPLFPKAAAIITDIGAPLSHAAIVARELGIPAVVGCGNATTLLKTGERVRVDGGLGIVERLN